MQVAGRRREGGEESGPSRGPETSMREKGGAGQGSGCGEEPGTPRAPLEPGDAKAPRASNGKIKKITSLLAFSLILRARRKGALPPPSRPPQHPKASLCGDGGAWPVASRPCGFCPGFCPLWSLRTCCWWGTKPEEPSQRHLGVSPCPDVKRQL